MDRDATRREQAMPLDEGQLRMLEAADKFFAIEDVHARIHEYDVEPEAALQRM